MQAKQTVVGNTLKTIFIYILFAVSVVFAAGSLSLLNPSSTAYADCSAFPGSVQGDASNPNRSNPDRCYDRTTNQDLGPAANPGQQTTPGQVNAPPGSVQQDDETTCAIEKIGWILCPVIEKSGEIGDAAFQFLAKFFLQTEPELVAENSGTKIAWELARNIANLMFIIAFVIIILSQVTGRGLDNYGIKRLLPKLIIAAVAVNVSYYLCQAMVDLSNIIGWELKNFMNGVAQTVSDRQVFAAQGSITQSSSGALAAMAVGVLAVAAVVYLLPMLISSIMLVALTCILIIVILLLRKAIIVMLVVLSPIAFVMYLLPNTEGLFKKWLKMFWQLLMVFPVVALLFGGGQLASAIVLVAGSTGTQSIYADDSGKCIQLPQSNANANTGIDVNGNGILDAGEQGSGSTGDQALVANCSASSTPFMLGLIAAGIAVAPLLAVVSVLKGALAATGAIGGFIQNMSKSSLDSAAKRRQENLEMRKLNKQTKALGNNSLTPASMMRRREARRRGKMDYSKSRNNRAYAEFIAGEAYDKESGELTRYGKQLAGGRGASEKTRNQVAADAINAQRQQEIEGAKAAHAVIDTMGIEELQEQAGQGSHDDPKTVAALERLIQLLGPGFKVKMADGTEASGVDHFASSGGSAASRALAEKYSAYNFLGSRDIDRLARGDLSESSNWEQMARTGMMNYTPDLLATASPKEKGYADTLANELAQTGDRALGNKLVEVKEAISQIDSLKGKML